MILKRRSFILGLSSLPLATPAFGQDVSAAPATKLIRAARNQIGVTVTYDGAYQSLSYPNGDIDRAKGVCTDVIVRAYRDAFEHDLQQAVHQDMRATFAAYPKIWGLSRPDRNIDHRRVPNLETYLTRQGSKRDLPTDLTELDAGDLLTLRLPRNLPHIALVSDKITQSGMPLIIHNIGAGTREDPLSRYQLDTLLHARFRHLDTALA